MSLLARYGNSLQALVADTFPELFPQEPTGFALFLSLSLSLALSFYFNKYFVQ